MPLKVFRVAHFLLEIFSLRVEAMRLDLDLLLAVGGTLRLDGDGFDLCDCAGADPAVWSAPGEATQLSVARAGPAGVVLDWTARQADM